MKERLLYVLDRTVGRKKEELNYDVTVALVFRYIKDEIKRMSRANFSMSLLMFARSSPSIRFRRPARTKYSASLISTPEREKERKEDPGFVL